MTIYYPETMVYSRDEMELFEDTTARNELEEKLHNRRNMLDKARVLQHRAKDSGMLSEVREWQVEIDFYEAQVAHYLAEIDGLVNDEYK